MSDAIRLGIFGWPVAHSKSPQMHESAASALGIELRYERFEVAPDDLADAVERKHEAGIDGYNLTVPHKEAIMALIDEVAPAARAIGAVNTVVRVDGRYIGHNTDAPGLVRSLEEAGVQVGDARVVVVGAGGAARAAVVGLANAGASEITVLSRRPEQGEALVRSLGRTSSALWMRLRLARRAGLSKPPPCWSRPRARRSNRTRAHLRSLRRFRSTRFRPRRQSSTWSTSRSRRRCSRVPKSAASPSSTASACCCTRARSHSRCGRGSSRRSMSCAPR